MTTEVSPFCHASERVVTVRVTLQELSPSPAANAVSAAISTEMITFAISFFVIIFKFTIYRFTIYELFTICRFAGFTIYVTNNRQFYSNVHQSYLVNRQIVNSLRFLIPELGFYILLRNSVRKEGGVLALCLERRFEGLALGRVSKGGFRCLCCGFQSCLACLYLAVLVVFDGVQQIHA